MLLVVCDATPLIYLAKIGRFDLLHNLHEEVLVPPLASLLSLLDKQDVAL
jgi:predicted nucleic acid-binding protein